VAAQDPGLSEGERLGRRNSFSAEAERYDRVRPSYPEVLFDRIAGFGGLEAGARVLELGAGTGKATRSLADRGWQVDAVELGEGMAAVLRERLGDRVRVVVGAFEEVPIVPAHYDLVVCATAFHWLDPRTRVERVARSLRPGGTAAIVWTRHVRGGTQAFFDASQHVYERAGLASEDAVLPSEADLLPQDDEFRTSRRFDLVETPRFVTEIAYDTATYLDLIGTYSETLAATPGQRAVLRDGLRTLIDRDFGGRVLKRYVFTTVLARRV
jgi:SAM-dependent methyltransferase